MYGKKLSITPFLVGVSTFFLPCGFTQSMQVYTLSTGTFLVGALTMTAFALGTLPVLILISFTSVELGKSRFSGLFFKTAGLLVIIFAFFNLYNIYNTNKESLFFSWSQISKTHDISINTNSDIETQTVELVAKGGFSPQIIEAKPGIKTILRIKTQATYDCSSSVVIPKIGYQKLLPATGVTEIEIPPQESGTELSGSCGMGMYRFTVKYQ